MWDMHPRTSDHDAANISKNSRKDHLAVDGPEKLVILITKILEYLF